MTKRELALDFPAIRERVAAGEEMWLGLSRDEAALLLAEIEFCGRDFKHSVVEGTACIYVPVEELPASADDEGDETADTCSFCGDAIALVGDTWFHDDPDSPENHEATPANLAAA